MASTNTSSYKTTMSGSLRRTASIMSNKKVGTHRGTLGRSLSSLISRPCALDEATSLWATLMVLPHYGTCKRE